MSRSKPDSDGLLDDRGTSLPRVFSSNPTALIGGCVWLVCAALLRPSPFDPAWAGMLLTFAALVLAPLALRLIPADAPVPGRVMAAAQLPAAVCLQIAFLLDPGRAAAAMAFPWLAWATVIGGFGLRRLWRHGLRSWPAAGIDVSMIYLVIGGGWTVLSRGGATPLEFKPIIVLLTGIHFHYAGFVLPIVCGGAACCAPGRAAAATAALVVAAVPLTAAGITSTQLGGPPALETVAAGLMSLGGVATAALLWRASRRELPTPRAFSRIAACCLAAAMILAALYGLRAFGAAPWLDIPWMRALHGTTNAFGFALPALMAGNIRRAAAIAGERR